jgi:hypothetical protein
LAAIGRSADPSLVKTWAVLIAMSCASEAQVPSPPDPEIAREPVAADAPIARAANAPEPSLAVDQPAVTLDVPSPPGFELAVTEPGEYRIDVTAEGEVDPSLYVYRDDTLVVHDEDGGEGDDARAILFLEPGTYSVRVAERNARPFDANVRAQRLAPLSPELTLELGPHATTITFPELPQLRRPENERDASKAVRVSIAAAGRYLCSVRMDNGRIARSALVRDGRVVASGAQRLTGIAAVIETELAAGDYELRMWDAELRGDMNAMVMCEPRAAAE